MLLILRLRACDDIFANHKNSHPLTQIGVFERHSPAFRLAFLFSFGRQVRRNQSEKNRNLREEAVGGSLTAPPPRPVPLALQDSPETGLGCHGCGLRSPGLPARPPRGPEVSSS